MERGPFIAVPEDVEKVKRLQAKLMDYEGRIRAAQEEGEKLDAHYKARALGELLKYGKVNTDILREELMKEEREEFNEALFVNACGVIRNYAEGS